jgi:hypothetical protein
VLALDLHAQKVVVHAQALFSRNRNDFERLASCTWQLSLSQLVSIFGCPPLLSRDFVHNLAELAEHAASVSWQNAWRALQAAQHDRKHPGDAFKRGIILGREWIPNDVTVATTALGLITRRLNQKRGRANVATHKSVNNEQDHGGDEPDVTINGERKDSKLVDFVDDAAVDDAAGDENAAPPPLKKLRRVPMFAPNDEVEQPRGASHTSDRNSYSLFSDDVGPFGDDLSTQGSRVIYDEEVGLGYEDDDDDDDDDFPGFHAPSAGEVLNESDASGRQPSRAFQEASRNDRVLVGTTNEQNSVESLAHAQLTPGQRTSAKALPDEEAISRKQSPVADPAPEVIFRLGEHHKHIKQVAYVEESTQRPPEITLAIPWNDVRGDTHCQPLFQAKATISNHGDQSGHATHPLRISSSPGPTSIYSSPVTCTKERLEGTRDGGWLSHADFSIILRPTLPMKFAYLEVPDHDPSTDWAKWATLGRKKSTDPCRVIFSIINDRARKHWVLLAIDLDKHIVSEYDSVHSVKNTMAVPARFITLRLGMQWEDGGWRYVRAHTPQQNDEKSCGVYALACIYFLVTDTAIPPSLDPRLWRQALTALVVATGLPLLPHIAVEPPLQQLRAAAMVSKQVKLAQLLKDWLHHVDNLVLVFSRLETALEHTKLELSTSKAHQILKQLGQIVLGATSLCVAERGVCTCSDVINLGDGPFAKAHTTYIAEHRAFEMQVQKLRSRTAALEIATERIRHMTRAHEEARREEKCRLDIITSDLRIALTTLEAFCAVGVME